MSPDSQRGKGDQQQGLSSWPLGETLEHTGIQDAPVFSLPLHWLDLQRTFRQCLWHGHMGTPGLSTASTGEGISPKQVQTDPNATAMTSEPFTAKQLAAQLHAAEDRLLLPGCLCFLCWLPIAVDNFKSNQTAARTGVPVGDMLSSLCGGCCAATTPAVPPGAII